MLKFDLKTAGKYNGCIAIAHRTYFWGCTKTLNFTRNFRVHFFKFVHYKIVNYDF